MTVSPLLYGLEIKVILGIQRRKRVKETLISSKLFYCMYISIG
jgi:hypothetical protein